MHKLLLMVTSASMLEKGTFPRHQFDKLGGLVGSAKHATWYINNLKNEIASIEFEIKLYNSDFCLLAYSSHIFINGSQKPLPRSAIVRLKDGDIISIANYKLRVKIYTHKSDNVSLQDDLYSLVKNVDIATLLPNEHHSYFQLESFNDKKNVMKHDDLLTTQKDQFELDPLVLLEDRQKNDDILTEFDLSNLSTNSQYYKVINEYIDTNIEYYEPLVTSNYTMRPILNESFDEKIDVINNTSKTLSEQTALQDRADKRKPDKTIVLDPLIFIK